MPRPRKGVTLANLNNVEYYFSRALRNERMQRSGWFPDYDLFYEAKEEFRKLPRVDSSDKSQEKISMGKRQKALQKWVDKYIKKEKWQRCLLTLRQDKSRKKLGLRQLNLKADIYRTVKIISQKKGITMGEVIKKFAEPMLKKIYKSEIETELRISEIKMKKKFKK